MFGSLQLIDLPMSNPSKCITNNLLKPSRVTTLVSTSKVYPLKISKEEMLPLTPKKIQLEKLKNSMLKLLSLITQVKSVLDIALSLIVTPPILPVNSIPSTPKLIEDLVKN